MRFAIEPDLSVNDFDDFVSVLKASPYVSGVVVDGKKVRFEARDADALSAVRREMSYTSMANNSK